jgi:FkbM family methyltransferase
MRISSLLKPHYLFRPSQAARRLMQALRGRTPASATVRLPWGLQLSIDPRESIGSAVWRLGLYDLAVSETLWRLTAPGDLTVDVGANLGHMTGILALRAGPTGRVLAFEPHPDVFNDLLENVALAAADPRTAPIETFRTALGAAEGTGQLATGAHFAANRSIARLVEDEEEGIPVQITTLDKALEGRTAAVVKIDVEGSTRKVLEGARESLREGLIRDLVYEAHEDERDLLTGILRGHGYTIYALGQAALGLILGGGGEAPRLPGYEAPSYVATREPSRVLEALRRRGWRVLSSTRIS